MNLKLQLGITLVALAVLGATAGLVRKGGVNRGAARAERKVLFYQDSMHPWVKSDRPGKCTVCEMDLTPIFEGQAGFGGENTVVIGTNQVTVLNVQTEAVTRRALHRDLRVAGTLEANETSKTVVSAPARGRIDYLGVDYAGVEVEEGQKLITMFSPELVQLRKTLLAVRDITRSGATNGITKAVVDSGIYTGDILAPRSGVVLERNVYNGQYVAEGDRLLSIADASVLWFRFDVYQDQLPWFEPGEPLEVEVAGIPGKTFPAVISFVEPTLNDATRTVKVRANIKNPMVEVNGHKKRLLKYGMYAEGRVRAEVPDVLAVPRMAILLPGGNAYAYVEKSGGAYERRQLEIGRQGDAWWEVLKGLEEGDRVVTAGNVLIDAQAQFNQVSNMQTASAGQMDMAEPVAGNEAQTGVPRHVMTASMQTPMTTTTDMAPAVTTTPPVMARPATQPMVQPQAREHASALRTRRMSAMMSPGAELQSLRKATIMKELAMNSPESTQAEPAASSQAPQTPPTPQPARAAEGKALLTDAQRHMLKEFLDEAAELSEALAADNLEGVNKHMASLPGMARPLPDALAAPHPLNATLKQLAAAKLQTAKDLADARKQFLPFSTALVDLTKQLRKQDKAFADLKVYHCPMAPEPGLWMQAKAPLANPYYGSKMLRCGEEVTR